MRRGVCILLALVLLLPLLAACGGDGNTGGVQLDPGASEYFSEEEIRSAMDCAMETFRRQYDGCTLTRLAYSEAYFDAYCAGGAPDDNDTIVLLADYVETESNTPHTSCPWVLTRAAEGAAWKVASNK